MKMRGGWYISDWSGQRCFPKKTFQTFNDAQRFLTQFIEVTCPETVDNDDRFYEEIGEYCVEQCA